MSESTLTGPATLTDAGADPLLLETSGLSKHFPVRKGMLSRIDRYVKAVDGVDLKIPAGKTVGLVGESGCGKSTLGRLLLRVLDPTDGKINYRTSDGRQVDLAALPERQMKSYRQEIRLIFQDPFASLNPRLTLGDIVAEPLAVHKKLSRSEIDDKVENLIRRVGLRPEYRKRYPNAFSGGERQRVGIARALALDPRLVVADEAVSALDVSVRAQILNLLKDLQEESDLTYLFISHDLGTVEYMADEVVVMYVGKVVEHGPTAEVFGNPQHPYTEALLSAVPDPEPDSRRERIVLRGEVADPSRVPTGCPFHPRCFYAQERCETEVPTLKITASGHASACHFADELELRGIQGLGRD